MKKYIFSTYLANLAINTGVSNICFVKTQLTSIENMIILQIIIHILV